MFFLMSSLNGSQALRSYSEITEVTGALGARARARKLRNPKVTSLGRLRVYHLSIGHLSRCLHSHEGARKGGRELQKDWVGHRQVEAPQ